MRTRSLTVAILAAALTRMALLSISWQALTECRSLADVLELVQKSFAARALHRKMSSNAIAFDQVVPQSPIRAPSSPKMAALPKVIELDLDEEQVASSSCWVRSVRGASPTEITEQSVHLA